jgi:hypothetical protein
LFLRSDSLAGAAAWDLCRPEEVPDLRTALVVAWPQVGRAARALELMERELRRCARAWGSAWDESSLLQDESVFTAPDWFFQALQRFPKPTGGTGLEILAAHARPLAVLARPADEVYAALAAWPATCVAYTMSVFNARFSVEVYEDCRLEGATYAEHGPALSALVDVTRDSWRGSTPGHTHQLGMDRFLPSTFRAIADSRDEEGQRYFGAHLLLLRTYDNGCQELVHGRLL